MRALFVGSPCAIAARLLWTWLENGNEVVEFWTPAFIGERHWRQDRWDGRMRSKWSVSQALRRHRIPLRVVGPIRRDREAHRRARALGADVLLSGCFMYRVPTEILDCFGDRAINFHPALLPMYRGADPRAAMILHGKADCYGGVTMHVMSPEFDTGDIVAVRRVPWGDARSFDAWDLAMGRAVGSMTAHELPRYLAGEFVASPQTGPASGSLKAKERRIALDDSMSGARMREVVDRLSAVRRVSVHTPLGMIRVAGFVRALGPATGGPPVVSRGRVELDASDQRVVLRRRRRFARLSDRLRRALLVRRTSSAHAAIATGASAPDAAHGRGTGAS